MRTPALHTRPAPSGGAFGALLCRKEFLLNCSSHSPRITERPAAQSLLRSGGCCARRRAGLGSEEQRLLLTPDLVVLLTSYLLKNAPTVGVCVYFFHFVEVFHPNFL